MKSIIRQLKYNRIRYGLSIMILLLFAFPASASARTDQAHMAKGKAISIIGGADGPTSVFIAGKPEEDEKTVAEYTSITMDEAKKVLAETGDYIILDVRRADEYAAGHIPGAINFANEDIGAESPEVLPDKEQTIYVYCRSGVRSKDASAKLTALGYSNIIECGGILDWTGEIEK